MLTIIDRSGKRYMYKPDPTSPAIFVPIIKLNEIVPGGEFCTRAEIIEFHNLNKKDAERVR